MDPEHAFPDAAHLQDPVLVVSGDGKAPSTLAPVLAGLSCRILHAASAREALEALASLRPAMILLDPGLPDGLGIACIHALRADGTTRGIPLLLIAEEAPGLSAAALAAGASDTLPPLQERPSLEARLRVHLELVRSHAREGRLRDQLDVCRSREPVAVAPPTSGPLPVPLLPQAGVEAPPPKVLVVDDSPMNLKPLVQFLRAGHKLLVATSGPAALDLVEQEHPDLILLDVLMPGMDGYEVCRRLKDDPRSRDIPVIFVTGKNEERDEVVGFELGAVDYITKPFSQSIVLARVRTHLELKRHRDTLERLSLLDGLTGIPNRRAFQDYLDLMWGQAIRQRSPLSAILMDVDHFKAFNDHYGHQAGDDCLRRVAQGLLEARRRGTDLVARYGGEEFICLLPGTEGPGAHLVAEALRAVVAELAIPHDRSSAADRVTLSLGVATRSPNLGDAAADLVEAADRALYRAKQGGRNRVEGAEARP